MGVHRIPRVTLVVPTYNEGETIAELIEALDPVRSSIERFELTMLIVDDSSPDGTGQLVEQLAVSRPWISLLTRAEKQGLGAAYKHGMRVALDRGADVIFEMDADLSHDPAEIPFMIDAIEHGADFVIGSRYVKGGQLPAHWPLKRRIISWMANAGARTLLGLRAHDCSGGYRAIRREVLERVHLDSIEASGYGFQLELIYRATIAGAVIDEVPIVFADRTHGSSKMRLADWWEMARLAFTLRFVRSQTASSVHPADA